jgi:alanyl-tRNA synthetase
MSEKNNYQKLIENFINFFHLRGYDLLPSSNLIVENDPTLLFTSAGMVQFKDVFLNLKSPQVTKVVTIQKCLRVGGKHNDLDNVGFTSRHNTFFEMIGVFGFNTITDGEKISKEQIITDAFDFLISGCLLDVRRLWITVDAKDTESLEIWKKIVPEERIILESSGENFWSMGDVGPCGPCTEILYDRFFNPKEIITQADVLRDAERFLEVWNIVFMCKIKNPNGIEDMDYTSIDSGMGLERLVSIMENVPDSFSSSILQPLMEKMKEYLSPETPIHVYRICADHLRTAAFLMGEGLDTSNGKHGYVLKKIIRRAVFYYHPYYNQPLLYKLLPTLREIMGNFHGEALADFIDRKLQNEEEKNITSLKATNKIIKKNIGEKGNSLSGKEAFYLYDTCGINLNLLQEYAHTHSIQLDLQGFEEEMNRQKLQSGQKVLLNDNMDTEFIGYDHSENHTTIIGLYTLEGNKLESTKGEENFLVFTEKTVFFPESGGQIGDTGYLIAHNQKYPIRDTTYYNTPEGLAIGHGITAKALDGGANLKIGDEVFLQIDVNTRLNTAKNHSATHLLDSAIIQLTGKNQQKGSKVYHDRFRLDFTAGRVLTKEDLLVLERNINQIINEDIPTEIKTMAFEDAVKEGYIFLENFYYGDSVRVVNLGGGFSKALCCGTHVKRTGEIAGVQITKMRLIRSNTYRIEGIAGAEFINYTKKSLDSIKKLCEILEIKIDIQMDSIDKITGTILRAANPVVNNEKAINSCHKIEYFQKCSYKYDNKNFLCFVGKCSLMATVLYDLEKNNYDFIILLDEKNAILAGSEKHRNHLSALLSNIKNSIPLIGGGEDRIFRGKITNTNTSKENYESLLKLFTVA